MLASRFVMALAIALALPILLTAHAATSSAPPTFYQTIETGGVWWFQSPDGARFFSLGVNVVSPGASREEYRPDKPEYASFRYYPKTDVWTSATLRRLHDWNFNTIGGWSDPAMQEGPLPFTPVLSLGESAGGLWSDLFSPEVAAKFDETAKRIIVPLRENPRLLGYFSDNELGWWSDALFIYFLKQPRTNHTHQVLIELLRNRYGNNFRSLHRDFVVGKSSTFDELASKDKLLLRPGGQGRKLVDDFTFLLAQRYYQLCHDSIRRYDEHHLILGDRYAGWYPKSVARAAGPYVDVISINSGADWKDGAISPFILKTLHELTGKPVLVSEFYMCATENRSGNKNSREIFPTVATQKERAAAFRTNLAALAALPFVIGAHWFQYFDEPTFGRSDGEDYNMGLVDINDHPYEELTAEAAALNTDAIHRTSAHVLSRHETLVPRLGVANSLWTQPQTLIESATTTGPGQPFADLYATWDTKFLYVVLRAAGYMDPHLYQGARLPLGEAMQWTVNVGAAIKPVRIRFGGNVAPVFDGGEGTVEMHRTSTRFTIVVKLPASSFGTGTLTNDALILIHSKLTSYGGLHTMEWSQPLRLTSSSPQAN